MGEQRFSKKQWLPADVFFLPLPLPRYFSFQPNSHSLGCIFISSQASSQFESKMALAWWNALTRYLTKIHLHCRLLLWRIHKTWKFLKGRSCFNKNSHFAAHLLSLRRWRDSRGELQIFFLVFLEGNLNSCTIWFYNFPHTAFRLISALTSCRG